MPEKGAVNTPETCRKRKQPSLSVDPSLVECPVCMNVFSGKVFQCKEGHAICEECKTRLPQPKKCPSCRGSLSGDIRCRALETMAEHAEVACGFDGCGFRGLNKGMKDHRKACDCRPYACPLKRTHACGWTGHLKELEEHLLSGHAAAQRTLSGNTSRSFAFKCAAELEGCYWPCILDHGSERYLLCCKREKTTKALRIGVLFLGLTSPRQYTLKISHHRRERSFSCPVRSIRDDKTDMDCLFASDDCLSLSNHTAMFMSAGSGDAPKTELNLTVYVQVQ